MELECENSYHWLAETHTHPFVLLSPAQIVVFTSVGHDVRCQRRGGGGKDGERAEDQVLTTLLV